MTYADHWNSRWRGALSQGPIQMISSGAWDHEVETVELMDEDDAAPLQASAVDIVLKDITSSRQYVVPPPASGSDDLDWDGMDIDSIASGANVLVVDTNILLSYLPLITSLTTYLSTHDDIAMIVIIPGVVIQELDHIKTTTRPIRNLAIAATHWLLAQAKERNQLGRGSIRGQKDAETLLGKNWRTHRNGLINDDVILDCCTYFSHRHHDRRGRVILLSADRNLCLKAETQEILTVTPSDGWSRKRLLIELGVQVDSSGPTSFASGLSELQTPPSPPYSAHRSTYNGTNLSPSKRGSGAYSRSASARSDSYTLAGSIHAPQNHRSSQQRATSTPADPHSGRELSGIYSRKGSSSSSVQPARPVSAQSLSYDTDYISQQRHGRSFTEQPNTSWDGSRESAQSQLLDALYARLISHLQTTLPPLVEQAVLFQQNRFLHGITTNPIPPDNEWRAWSLPRSIHYLYDSPPPSLHNSLKKSGHAQSHPLFRLAEFATLNGRGQPVRSGCDIPRWEWVLIAEALTMLYAEDVVLDFRQQLDQAWAGGVR